MTEWKKEICSTQPPEVESVAPGKVICRRNITEVHHDATDNMETYTDWECEYQIMGESDYQMLKNIEQINTDAAIDAYTEQLMEEGLL